MNRIYQDLARALDRIPNGYPPTESGVELKLLEHLFTVEEAEVATFLNLTPKTAEEIAQTTQRDEKKIQVILKEMLKKGLISVKKKDRKLGFKLIPFIVGFYENQNANITKEFAELFEQYYLESLFKIMTVKPSVHRVIPIEQNIPVNIEVMPYQKASTYLEKAKSWGVLNCICRLQKQLIGEGCHHSIENCLVFSPKENHFKTSEYIRNIDKAEAYQILEQAHREGLVHSTANTQDEVNYICNCCTCSCGVMRSIADTGSENSLAASDFYISIDIESCTACGDCVETCQFKALSLTEESCQADLERCYGCGICIRSCPVEALELYQKPLEAIEKPPLNDNDWMGKRANNRGFDYTPDF